MSGLVMDIASKPLLESSELRFTMRSGCRNASRMSSTHLPGGGKKQVADVTLLHV